MEDMLTSGRADDSGGRCILIGFGPGALPSASFTKTTTKSSRAGPQALKSQLSSAPECKILRTPPRGKTLLYAQLQNITITVKKSEMDKRRGLTASIFIPRYNPRWPTSLCQSARMLGCLSPLTSGPPPPTPQHSALLFGRCRTLKHVLYVFIHNCTLDAS